MILKFFRKSSLTYPKLWHPCPNWILSRLHVLLKSDVLRTWLEWYKTEKWTTHRVSRVCRGKMNYLVKIIKLYTNIQIPEVQKGGQRGTELSKNRYDWELISYLGREKKELDVSILWRPSTLHCLKNGWKMESYGSIISVRGQEAQTEKRNKRNTEIN